MSARSINPSPFSDWVIIVSQIILYIVSVVPLRLFARAKRRIPGNIRALGGGSLLLANHQSMGDPFVITMHLPFYAYLRILPIRFPTSDVMFKNRLLNPHFFPLLAFLGCYSIGATSQEKMLALFYTRKLLQDGYAVFLFPEGRISKESSVQGLQKGVEFFKNDAHNIIFIRTHGFHEGKDVKFLFKKRSITYGDILPARLTMNAEQMHQYLNTL